MMSTEDLHSAAVQVPDGYTLALDRDGPVVVASLTTKAGAVAAGGPLALSGSAAVFDRIETHPDHRRRGLGQVVMGALARQARLSGAKADLLVATPDRRAPYGALGWRVLTPYTTALHD